MDCCRRVIFVIVLVCFVRHSLAGDDNTVNANGTINWADLPPITDDYESPAEYDEGKSPYPGLWAMIDGWINVVSPGSLPYDLINDALGGSFEITEVTNHFTDYSSLLLGFAICFVIGALFLIIFPIVCVCFCCCRCCGKCGGKMYQKQTGNMSCKRWTFILILTCVTVVLAGGMACCYFVNERQTTEFPAVGPNVIMSLDDLFKFVDNTVDEITFVAISQTSWIFEQVKNDLDNVGTLVGVPIQEALDPVVQPAIDAVLDMVDTITDTRDGLSSLNAMVTDLDSNYTDLTASLSTLKSNIDTLYTTCVGCSPTPGSMVSTSTLVTNRDFSDVISSGTYPRINVTATIVALDAIIANDLKGEAKAGEQTYKDIPEMIQNETSSAIGDLTDSFDDFEDEIASGLDPMIEALNNLSSQTESFYDIIDDVTENVERYGPYRSNPLIVLCCILLAIVCLNLLGIAFGIIGYDTDATPTRRGGLSNCGGILLMSAVGLCFSFACIYMLLTAFPFIVGGPVHKIICQPILTHEIFEKTIDQPDIITDGYFLGDLMFDDGNVSLTVTGILDGCENNLAAFTVFQLENIVNISQFLDIDEFIPDGQFDDLNVNISDQIEIMSDTTRDNLLDAQNAGAADIDWTVFKAELNSNLIDYGENLDVFADALQAYIDSSPGFPSGVKNDFQSMVTVIRDLQDGEVDPLVSLRDQVLQTVLQVETDSNTIDTAINLTIWTAEAADVYIENNLDSVVADEINAFQTRILDYPRQFVDYVKDMIFNEIGKCRPVYNLLQHFINTVCRSFLDAFNGLWFCMGWCVFFMIPSIIFGVKLAKYFRRMNEEDVYDDGMEMQDKAPSYKSGPPINAYGKNKVDPAF
ncbi:prominin-1-A-like [Saccoglossus kowalevskii]|uniref:Prominin-1-A-like n=1 Tax=Saccoglossus kowalevskii TaxID=10224 RepID=A0ABM0H141_SACKO|nr:PREDICTED: prominin-1-A-like [Saccoglossus kowalevskii]